MDYNLEKYYSIIKKCGFNSIDKFEYYVFSRRFDLPERYYKFDVLRGYIYT